MPFILGVSAFRPDSAACLVRDGIVVAAAEEERFRRIKHWAGFPREAIRYCLAEAGMAPADLAQVAVAVEPRAAPDMLRELRSGLAGEPAAARGDARAVPEVVGIALQDAQLAAAFLASPFPEAVVLSVAGAAPGARTVWGVGSGTRIELHGGQDHPDALGLFYRMLTRHIGFPGEGDEYKVMGLAPYGSEALVPLLRRLVGLRPDGGFRLDPALLGDGCALEALLGPARRPGEPLAPRHFDIARATQAIYEETLFHLLDALHARHGLDALALGGDGGLNSAANGRIRLRTPFRRVHVPPAPGDAGLAIGAALLAWHRACPHGDAPRAPALLDAGLGPAFGDEAIGRVLDAAAAQLAAAGCTLERIADAGELVRRTAADIAAGRVVGWFQGRMEWGPRALGNRSILGDPRRADMKDVLNLKIKRRESFRPFAPSVLREAVAAWFEQDGDVPFMSQVFRIRAERRPQVPAVTHVDGSGRLQTVEERANPLYYRLIRAFCDITGVPMVLNTSFNENEPVVCRPEEALACFLRTDMDVLAMGGWVVRRSSSSSLPGFAGGAG
ncbi:carbamoyltransferase family protein [Thauera sinica]|uniref:Carbamoyltransferase n=1 Tax=Thauera sinica TaxID=2665146 RepID=A0ABW1APX4_9RHOO|nr:carbamoyltransferase C-terminal domain-containing protein [Thauera sp. K11]ATE62233.1 carbamoyltransferase [Thauera sp. K11]